MKKIINGKKYDTETATLVADYDDWLGWGDFNHVEMKLYKKKTGGFFLFGEGGPNSLYAERAGNMWAAGSAIKPMTEAEAKAWVEKYANEKYEEIFGEVEEYEVGGRVLELESDRLLEERREQEIKRMLSLYDRNKIDNDDLFHELIDIGLSDDEAYALIAKENAKKAPAMANTFISRPARR